MTARGKQSTCNRFRCTKRRGGEKTETQTCAAAPYLLQSKGRGDSSLLCNSRYKATRQSVCMQNEAYFQVRHRRRVVYAVGYNYSIRSRSRYGCWKTANRRRKERTTAEESSLEVDNNRFCFHSSWVSDRLSLQIQRPNLSLGNSVD